MIANITIKIARFAKKTISNNVKFVFKVFSLIFKGIVNKNKLFRKIM